MNIQLVPVLMVDQIWPQVAEGLGKSLEYAPDMTLGWLWTECRKGDAFLFIAHEAEVSAASIWRFENWRDGPRFKCLALYGKNMKTWLEPMADAVRLAAKHGGAVALAYEGRPGWERLFNGKRIRAVYEVAR